jgi:hypothetical protein
VNGPPAERSRHPVLLTVRILAERVRQKASERGPEEYISPASGEHCGADAEQDAESPG